MLQEYLFLFLLLDKNGDEKNGRESEYLLIIFFSITVASAKLLYMTDFFST